MNTQPEALRLADELFDGIVFGGVSIEVLREAQNELRRLHEIEKLFLAYKLEQEAAKEQT